MSDGWLMACDECEMNKICELSRRPCVCGTHDTNNKIAGFIMQVLGGGVAASMAVCDLSEWGIGLPDCLPDDFWAYSCATRLPGRRTTGCINFRDWMCLNRPYRNSGFAARFVREWCRVVAGSLRQLGRTSAYTQSSATQHATQMWYHCIQYTKHHHRSLVSHC